MSKKAREGKLEALQLVGLVYNYSKLSTLCIVRSVTACICGSSLTVPYEGRG